MRVNGVGCHNLVTACGGRVGCLPGRGGMEGKDVRKYGSMEGSMVWKALPSAGPATLFPSQRVH